MTRHPLLAAALAAACLAPALPALAASSTSSAASDSASSTVGSLSDSVQGSSNSSSGDRKTAAGDYRVTEVAAVEQRPGDLRLTLAAVPGSGAEGEFYLYVPRRTVDEHAIATGMTVNAQDRPYGLQFALGDARRPFFLAVDDAWLRELRTTPVSL